MIIYAHADCWIEQQQNRLSMNIFEQKKNFSLGKIYSDGDIFQKSELQETYEWSKDVITKSFKNCIFLELDNPNMISM